MGKHSNQKEKGEIIITNDQTSPSSCTDNSKEETEDVCV
jgi:hypothetical protein